MENNVGMRSLDTLAKEDLKGKTIFIRVDFNVPMVATNHGYYRVADDTRIRRFLDLTFKKIHELTEGECRMIIGSHLGRPHVKKGHAGWDGKFNIQFVCSHFDTLLRKMYGDCYTVFPPEITDSQLMQSLEIVRNKQLPIGGIKLLPNLRYLLDPENPDSYRKEFMETLSQVSDVYINCAFGCSHRVTKSVKMLPQIMREQGKLALAGSLLYDEIKQIGNFGGRILEHPEKTVLFAGGAKISDKIGILKQFVNTKIQRIFLGGKMVNAFHLAKQYKNKIETLTAQNIPAKLSSEDEAANQNLLKEISLAHEILSLAEKNNVWVEFPLDFKIVTEYEQTAYQVASVPDFNKELQLDLGPKTIEYFSKLILESDIENIFWNGPLGAYDHPFCDFYAEGSIELAKLLFSRALANDKVSMVIGGGDTAAILNKFHVEDLKNLIRSQLQKRFPSTICHSLVSIEFPCDIDCYNLYNYFTSNFFVSTGGGAALEFLEHFLKDGGHLPLASYLPGTATLTELKPA